LLPDASLTEGGGKISICFACIEELVSYFAYVVTVWELFSDSLTQKRLTHLFTTGTFDRLVKVRQYLAVDFALARGLLMAFRKKEQMKALPSVLLLNIDYP
jgi:hypothetical protein